MLFPILYSSLKRETISGYEKDQIMYVSVRIIKSTSSTEIAQSFTNKRETSWLRSFYVSGWLFFSTRPRCTPNLRGKSEINVISIVFCLLLGMVTLRVMDNAAPSSIIQKQALALSRPLRGCPPGTKAQASSLMPESMSETSFNSTHQDAEKHWVPAKQTYGLLNSDPEVEQIILWFEGVIHE